MRKVEMDVYRLHDSILNHWNVTANRLLEQGVDWNARYEDETTPVMWAARAQNVEMVRRLIELGADLQAEDSFGLVAFDHAAIAGEFRMGAYTAASVEIMKLLEENGGHRQ